MKILAEVSLSAATVIQRALMMPVRVRVKRRDGMRQRRRLKPAMRRLKESTSWLVGESFVAKIALVRWITLRNTPEIIPSTHYFSGSKTTSRRSILSCLQCNPSPPPSTSLLTKRTSAGSSVSKSNVQNLHPPPYLPPTQTRRSTASPIP